MRSRPLLERRCQPPLRPTLGSSTCPANGTTALLVLHEATWKVGQHINRKWARVIIHCLKDGWAPLQATKNGKPRRSFCRALEQFDIRYIHQFASSLSGNEMGK